MTQPLSIWMNQLPRGPEAKPARRRTLSGARVRMGGWGILLALGLGLGLAGCGQPTPPESEPVAAAYDPGKDPLVNVPSLFEPAPGDLSKINTNDTLFLNLDGSPQTLNPIFMSSMYEFIVADLLFDSPFTFDSKMEWKINPDWVESFQESEDHLSFTVKLKSGLHWQDGTP
ncbi:MAG TPA: hypothetical protein PK360_14740, partial [bacterium]|nr:hypothetical protein [bacterium]